jgi:hypothetical protein
LDTHAIYDDVWDNAVSPAIEESMKELRDLKRDVPERLLHFTSAAAVVPIIEKRTLRLTRAMASNDPEETAYGLNLARGLARELLNPNVSEDAAMGKELFASFAGRMVNGSKQPLPDPHICCFSRPEAESQAANWALYGRGGSGFALVFDGHALADTKRVDLVPVLYDAGEQQARLRALITLARDTCAAARQRAVPYGSDYIERSHRVVAHAFGAVIAVHAATMKRDAFAFEKEWRFLVHHVPIDIPEVESPKYGVEAVGPIIRSYYEVHFAPTALKEIIVGQTHAKLSVPVVESMLRQYGFGDDVAVRVESITLRSFS